jgi:hypothetical protein
LDVERSSAARRSQRPPQMAQQRSYSNKLKGGKGEAFQRGAGEIL